MEEREKSLTITLKDSEEWCKEMIKPKLLLQKECTLAKNELDKLKKKNSDLWMECQHYKKMSSDLNYKLKECEVLRALPLEVVKIYEIETLRDKLGNFVGGHEALNKILKV